MKVVVIGKDGKHIAEAFRKAGHEVKEFETVDQEIPELQPDVIWVSPPCSALSKAGAWKHWEVTEDAYIPKTEVAKEDYAFLDLALEMISNVKPKLWFVELPMGLGRKMETLQGLPRLTTTFCQYGYEFRKETDIWTNIKGWNIKTPCKNGAKCHKAMPRGVPKSGKNGGINTLWGEARAVMPEPFCNEVVEVTEKAFGIRKNEGTISADDLIVWHNKISEEMENRGIKHNSPLPPPEKQMSEEKEYKDPMPSGKVDGPEITLEEVLKHLGNFKITENMISLVGGVVNNYKTSGDIDIMIRTLEDDPITVPLRFRILRMFPEHLRERIHFLFENTTNNQHIPGPYTSHVPLFDIEANIKKPLKRVQMSEITRELGKQLGLTLGRFFTPAKPMIGYKYQNMMGWDAMKALVEDWPVYVQKKYDGARVQWHKDGDDIKAFSDDGHRIEHRMPTLVNELRTKWPEKVILDSEVEIWKNGEKLGREEISGFLRQVQELKEGQDAGIVANVFDLLYHSTNDKEMNMVSMSYEERVKHLSRMPFSETTDDVPKVGMFNRTPSYKAENVDQMIEIGKKQEAKPGS